MPGGVQGCGRDRTGRTRSCEAPCREGGIACTRLYRPEVRFIPEARYHKAVKIAMHWIKSYRDLDFRSLGTYTRADLDRIAAAPDAF